MILYRYFDGFDEPYLEEFRVVKATYATYLLESYGVKRRMMKGSNFAHATKEKAMKSYIARKHSQIGILTARLDKAKRCLAAATGKPMSAINTMLLELGE